MNAILNPKYHLYVDSSRVVLLTKDTFRAPIISDEVYNLIIHPLLGLMLNFFDGNDYIITIKNISKYLDEDYKSIKLFTDKLLDNSDICSMEFEGINYYLPPNCLISTNTKKRNKIKNRKFEFKQNLSKLRFDFPYDITLMVSTKCATDCIYCYADRRILMDCEIPLSRIKELIDEAKENHSRVFDIIGGEFLMYKNWKEIIQYLIDNDFIPYLSTKIPLSTQNITDIKELGMKDIQISLDSLISKTLCDSLKVKNTYLSKMINSLNLLEKNNIIVYIHTILNNQNDKIEDMLSLYNFFKSKSNIGQWKIDLAAPSLYLSSDYETYKPNRKNLKLIEEFFKDKTESWIKHDIKIDDDVDKTYEKKVESFRNRTTCSANRWRIFILPDGNVTICEELYWTKNFLIGNILDSSIKNIWDSEKAKNSTLVDQCNVPEDSICSNCNDYYNCKISSKQVCYRDIIKAYGEENWHYPDTKCPKAPKFIFPTAP